MVVILVLQRLFGLASLATLIVGGWLVGMWWTHRDAVDADWARDDRWLYVGLALLVWPLLGRVLLPLVLAKPGADRHRLKRAAPTFLNSPTGATLRVETYGRAEGDTLVFTHGWGMDGTIWYEAKRQLGERFRLVVWDLPGLGGSKLPPDGRLEVERMADDLRQVVEFAGGRVVLVGHSIGGMILQSYCRLHADTLGRQVAGVVLENTTHINPLRTIILAPLLTALRPVLEVMMRLEILLQPIGWLMNWQSYQSGSTHLAMRLAGFGGQPTRRQLDHTALLTTRNPPGVQAKGNLAMFSWGETENLPRIRIPMLVFAGRRDIVTKPQAGETIASAVPAARLIPVEAAGHMGPVEKAAVYNTAISEFAAAALARPTSA